MKDDVREREAAKYARMWSIPEYRRLSPGEELISLFMARSGIRHGQTVIDFGCGTGRPALRMQNAGLRVTGVDLIREALDPVPAERINFVEACLWDLPPNLRADWGFCTDVMEHVPPEKVPLALTHIHGACEAGCFFQIATFRDGFGRRIGETLHETVQPRSWWFQMLRRHWRDVEILGDMRSPQFLCRN